MKQNEYAAFIERVFAMASFSCVFIFLFLSIDSFMKVPEECEIGLRACCSEHEVKNAAIVINNICL